MTPAVRAEVRPDRVAVLTIDQPDAKVNVLTGQLWADLGAAVDGLAARADLAGVVVASGKPGVFVAGADLKLLGDAPGPNDPAVRAFLELGLRVLGKLDALPVPTCAAIDGAALGGGLEVALACDYRAVGSHPRTQLGLPEVKLGLIPGWGGTQRLPRLVGLPAAADLLTTGNPVGGPQALDLGLVDAAADSAGLLDAAARLVLDRPGWADRRAAKHAPLPLDAHPTAKMPPVTAPAAVREAYRVATEGAKLPLDAGIRLETAAFLQLAGSAESKELIAEFFAARKK
jgi:enoyl-CoA hydratase/carnithine racemase